MLQLMYVFEILGIDDGVSQTKLFKLTDIELAGRIEKAISDEQVTNVEGYNITLISLLYLYEKKIMN